MIDGDGSADPIRHALLAELGLEHGFGVRAAAPMPHVIRPVQVHGVAVARVDATGTYKPDEADAIVATKSGQTVGIVTADCVPILVASGEGRAVAAIHAGWRGLAAGVVEAGVRALFAGAAERVRTARAVVGPCIGPCCYEVDEPVTSALRRRFADGPTEEALLPTSPGHALLDLAALVERDLMDAGIARERLGRVGGCTHCEADRFHSFRRDADRAGRLLHFIGPR